MLDALPPVLVDRICLFLHHIHDASALQRTCKRLREAGLGPECKWHWRLNSAQSLKLYKSHSRNAILEPGTAIHTFNVTYLEVADMPFLRNVYKRTYTPLISF